MKNIVSIVCSILVVAIIVALFQDPINQPDLFLTHSGWISLAIIFTAVSSPIFILGFRLLVKKSLPIHFVIIASGFYALITLMTSLLLLNSAVGNMGIFVPLFLMVLYSFVINIILRYISTKSTA